MRTHSKFNHLTLKAFLSSVFVFNLSACYTPLEGDGVERGGVVEISSVGSWHVNDNGKIAHNGKVQPIRCANWHGLQGLKPNTQSESDSVLGVMELLVGNPWWVDSGRTLEQTLDELQDYGINTLRIPIAPETLDASHVNGYGLHLINHESVQYKSARANLESLVVAADDRHMNIILSLHKCNHRVGWRAGQLDYDPGIDPGFSGTPDASCLDGASPYGREPWLQTLAKMAVLPYEFGTDNIIGIDIYNEPWAYTWGEWKELAEAAYKTINHSNADLLVFVQGIGQVGEKGELVHGSESSLPAWSENFFGFNNHPLAIPKHKLVISPHIQGPSVFRAPQYLESSCKGMSESEATAAQCNLKLDTAQLYSGWDEHFAYLKTQSYGVVVGEFGGNLDWPLNGSPKDQQQWAHIEPGIERDFQKIVVDYLLERDIDGCYWSVNPESSDDDFRGGLYQSSYQAETNENDWGVWLGFDPEKKALLHRFWGMDENNSNHEY